MLDSEAWAEALQCEYLAGFTEANDHDAAFAVYTSGTTGNPKGVLHEYGNIDYIVKSLYENGENPLIKYDNFALIAPLYFVVTVIACVATLDAGIRLSIVPFSITKTPRPYQRPSSKTRLIHSSARRPYCASYAISLL